MSEARDPGGTVGIHAAWISRPYFPCVGYLVINPLTVAGIPRLQKLVTDNPCRLNRSMQRPSNLLIRQYISQRTVRSGRTQLNLNREVFCLNPRA
jgi:hypothetical protein